jgi:hypothetical protein
MRASTLELMENRLIPQKSSSYMSELLVIAAADTA